MFNSVKEGRAKNARIHIILVGQLFDRNSRQTLPSSFMEYPQRITQTRTPWPVLREKNTFGSTTRYLIAFGLNEMLFYKDHVTTTNRVLTVTLYFRGGQGKSLQFSRHHTTENVGVDMLHRILSALCPLPPHRLFIFPPSQITGTVPEHLPECRQRRVFVISAISQSWSPLVASASVQTLLY